MLENAEGAIKNGLSRETGNKQDQKKTTTQYVLDYSQANTNNINKTCSLLQTTGGKDKPNIVFMRKS